MGKVVSNVIGSITGANDARDAANAAAEQQRIAAQNASYASAFRPVGLTTSFGTSQFTRGIDPKTGMPFVESAAYTGAPELQALQSGLFGLFGQGLGRAASTADQLAPLGAAGSQLFNLGQQYLAQSPEQAAQNYMTAQQNLLAPAREQQLASIRNKVFQTGRGGLGVGGTMAGGRAATSPEMAAYYNALAQQDAQLAAQAEQAGQQRATFGAGLFGTGAGLIGTQAQLESGAFAPLQTQLGLASNVEGLMQQPLNLGLQIGQAQVPGQTAGAQMYGQGMAQAAQTQAQGAMQAAQMNSAFLNNLIGSAAGAYGMSKLGGATPSITPSAGGLGSLSWTSPLSGAMSSFGSSPGISLIPNTSAFGIGTSRFGL